MINMRFSDDIRRNCVRCNKHCNTIIAWDNLEQMRKNGDLYCKNFHPKYHDIHYRYNIQEGHIASFFPSKEG